MFPVRNETGQGEAHPEGGPRRRGSAVLPAGYLLRSRSERLGALWGPNGWLKMNKTLPWADKGGCNLAGSRCVDSARPGSARPHGSADSRPAESACQLWATCRPPRHPSPFLILGKRMLNKQGPKALALALVQGPRPHGLWRALEGTAEARTRPRLHLWPDQRSALPTISDQKNEFDKKFTRKNGLKFRRE